LETYKNKDGFYGVGCFKILWNGSLIASHSSQISSFGLGVVQILKDKKSIDKNFNPIPWWTYPTIAFLQDRLTPNLKVLEFGSGASTLWLCRFALEVISIEDNKEWGKYVQSRLPENGTLIITDSYENFIDAYHSNSKFDIIIIDAGDRLNIGGKIVHLLSDDGVIIWDNTDGPDWTQIKNLLSLHNFLEISFQGMIAQEIAISRTTIFYRKMNNCLGI